MFNIPTQLTINGVNHPIRNKGDYRMVIDCFNALSDVELGEEERVLTCLIIFYDEINDLDDLRNVFGVNLKEPVEKMYEFFNCGQRSIGYVNRHKLVDWDKDSQLIASAINNVSKQEIRSLEYLHWWTFMGYYLSIGDSPFSTIVGIRNKIKSGKKLEDYEKKFRKENPDYFVWDDTTQEQKDAMYIINNLWSKK